ncbi:conserved hypothetical protein [Candidatus Nitrosymbiomonas proteolyticus]|uniref:Uncharacterized protein n=1 Tax=Candidatus Nitrosymbiomonas proteolyticus TaxID=2608984 RepID=A0A809R8A1_9BACT|nr:conserved hypothetical protein [Candidatus Nitrosymbiomonas proteolyticus]
MALETGYCFTSLCYVRPPSIPDLWILQVALAVFVASYAICACWAVLRLSDSLSLRLFLSLTVLLYSLPGALLLCISTNPEDFVDSTHYVWWGSLVPSVVLGPLSWWIAKDVRRTIGDLATQAKVLKRLWLAAGILWVATIGGLVSGIV